MERKKHKLNSIFKENLRPSSTDFVWADHAPLHKTS